MNKCIIKWRDSLHTSIPFKEWEFYNQINTGLIPHLKFF